MIVGIYFICFQEHDFKVHKIGSVSADISQSSLFLRLGVWVVCWRIEVILISAFNYVIVKAVAEIGNMY